MFDLLFGSFYDFSYFYIRQSFSRNQGQREIPVHENTHYSNHQQQQQQQSWYSTEVLALLLSIFIQCI